MLRNGGWLGDWEKKKNVWGSPSKDKLGFEGNHSEKRTQALIRLDGGGPQKMRKQRKEPTNVRGSKKATREGSELREHIAAESSVGMLQSGGGEKDGKACKSSNAKVLVKSYERRS